MTKRVNARSRNRNRRVKLGYDRKLWCNTPQLVEALLILGAILVQDIDDNDKLEAAASDLFESCLSDIINRTSQRDCHSLSRAGGEPMIDFVESRSNKPNVHEDDADCRSAS